MLRPPRHGPVRSAVLGLIAGIALFSPLRAGAADPQFPAALRVGIIPPPGFVASASFAGFQHSDKKASIILSELPGYAYENIEKEVAAELQRNPGAATRQDLELKDGARGFLLKATQSGPQGDMLKWTMVANAREVTAIVAALVPESVKEVAPEAALIAAFSSLAVRASVPVEEQLSVLPFSMRDLAGFRIVRVQPGSAAMLTEGDSDVVDTSSQPLLLVTIGPVASAPPQAEREGLARRMMGEMPGLKDMRVVRSEPMRIVGQQGHEIVVDAKDARTGADLGAVQWIRFGAGTLLRIVGVAPKDKWDDLFQRFRHVRDGIGPR